MTTSQKALQAAIDLFDKEGFIEEGEIQAVKELCKSALSDLDGCEPVAEISNWNEIKWHVGLVDLPIGTNLFTSPIRKVWVGLNDEQRASCWVRELSYYDPRLIEAKLKQLNLKGYL